MQPLALRFRPRASAGRLVPGHMDGLAPAIASITEADLKQDAVALGGPTAARLMPMAPAPLPSELAPPRPVSLPLFH